MSKQASFSAVRTDPAFKRSVEKTLELLGLSWGTFVKNAARELVQTKRVTFEIRDDAGFTPAKSAEMHAILADVAAQKNMSKRMNLKEAQEYLMRT